MTTHNDSYSDTYKTWIGMRKRCKKGPHYVKNGVQVCDRWLHSYENFLADMGKRPGPEYTIERKKNHLGYTPENCCWATNKEQARNKTTNNFLTYQGVTLCLTDWAEKLNIPEGTIRGRLRRGWNIEKTFTTPCQVNKVFLEYKGETRTMSAWSKELGIPQTTLQRKISRGMTLTEIVETNQSGKE